MALVFLVMMLRLEYDRQNRTKKRKTKKTQGQTASNKVRAKNIKKNNLYDACNEFTYDACSNALKFVQLYFINKQLT